MIPAANLARSTVSAIPPGTAERSATWMSSEPARRSSSLSSPGALCGKFDLREFEQTSSPSQSVLCAGVGRAGRIS